jgi:MFS-type transporter involved in bile tolerance (Atg22 family)
MLSTVPFLTAAAVMVIVGRHSDATQERRWHLALSAFAGALALAASAAAGRPWLSLLTISIAAAGVSSAAGPFWTIPASFLEGTAAAGGIALINSTGNLAGFVGPSIVGLVRQRTGTFAGGLLAMAVAMLIATGLVFVIPGLEQRQIQGSALEDALHESS